METKGPGQLREWVSELHNQAKAGEPVELLLVGHKGAGKTNAARCIALTWPGPVVCVDAYYVMRYPDVAWKYLPDVPAEWGNQEPWPGERGTLVVLDEVDRLCRGSDREEQRRAVLNVAHVGRNMGWAMLMTARKLSSVHPDLVDLADYLVVGRTRSRRSLKQLELEDPGVPQLARTLPRGRFLVLPV